MINKIRKYLIPSLAALLILSNFSYATNLMLCSMKDMDVTCGCTHKAEYGISGINVSKVKNQCCEEETILLSNSNLLNTVKSENPVNSLVLLSYISSSVLENTFTNNFPVIYKLQDKIPKEDIPISVSSLII
jgi:hypothetical protein